jgi:hypothetical protein
MSFSQFIKSKISQIKEDTAKIASNALDNKLEKDIKIRTIRINTCNNCDKLFKPTGTCMECGCFVAGKTWLKDAKCPLGKW